LEAAAETVGIKNFDHMLTLLPKKAVTQLLTEASTTGAVDFKRLLASIPKEQRTEIELRDNASPALRQIRQGMDDVKGASTSLKTVMLGTFAGNAILAGISAITNGLKEMTAQAITSYDAINTFDKTMTFAGFGKKQIHEASEELRDYSRATIYNVGEMSNTAATLAANGVKNFTGVTKSLGNLVAVSGGGADAMKSASLALTQIVGAGKMYTGDWNQFINMIPGASKKIQDQLKKNGAYTGNFRDAMSKGQITAKEFVKALNELGSTDVAKKAATDTSKFSTAWQGMQESIQDGILNIMDAMGTKGITGAISGFGNVVYDVFDGIAKAIKVLSKTFGMLGKAISPATSALGKLAKAAHVGDIFKVSASGVAIFAGSFLTLNKSIKALSELKKTTKLVNSLAGSFKKLGTSMVTHPYVALAAALITLAAALIYAYNHSKTFREWVNKNKESLMTLAKVVGIAVAAFAGFKIMTGIVGGLMKVASVVKTVSAAIKGLSAVSKVVSGIKALGSAFGLLTNPVGLVIAAIVAVGAAFVLLYKHNAKFRSWVNGLAKNAKAGAKRMADGFKSGVNSAKKHLDKLGKDINSAAKNAKSGAKKIGDNIRNGVKSGVDKTKSSFDKLKKNLSNMNKDAKVKTRQMAKILQSAFDKLPSGVKKAVRNIENNVKGVVDVVKDMTRLVRAIARGDWKGAWEAFKDVVGDSWKLISNLTKNSINGVQDLVDAGLDVIKGAWNSAWSAVADYFSSIWNRIKADAKAGINAVIDIINGDISEINSVISFFDNST
ncbi:MAG: tape measure protein, partial [Limosilactobacillus sp.]|nr:tape measure protein [Limosilactobacillus sp.]